MGEVIGYCASNNGCFDGVDIPEIDKTLLFNKAVETLNADGTVKQDVKCNDIIVDCVDNKIVYAVHVCYFDSGSNETVATVININVE